MAAKGVDPLRRYADAAGEVERLAGELARMGALFAQLGSELERSPVRVMIADGRFQAPDGVASEAPIAVSPEEWPSWERFRDTLAAYYAAQEEEGRAEHDLSPSDRRTLGLP